MPARNVVIMATFEPITYTITIGNSTNGTAYASAQTAIMGATVTLTPQPADGYKLLKWVLDDNTEFTGYTFTMPARNVTVTAVFEAIPYTITIGNSTNGSAGTSHTEATVGMTVSLTATPNPGYIFVRWATNPSTLNIVDNTFTMPARNVTITAVFEPISYTITVQNEGHGTVSGAPSTSTVGTSITLTPVPNAGYKFKEWQTADVTFSGNTFTMPARNVTITAVFEPIVYSITVNNDGNGTGSASPPSATIGTMVTLTAVPKEGYRFLRWEVSGGIAITGNTFTMPAGNVTVTAVFEIIKYNVTIAPTTAEVAVHSNYGDLANVPHGTKITLTVTVTLGSPNLILKVNGERQLESDISGNIHVFIIDVKENMDIRVTAGYYTVRSSEGAYDISYLIPSNGYSYGDLIDIRILIGEGFVINSVVITAQTDGKTIPWTIANGVYSFIITDDLYIHADVEDTRRDLSVLIEGYSTSQCTVAYSGGSPVKEYTTISFTITPNDRFWIKSVTVFQDGSSNGTIMNASGNTYSWKVMSNVRIVIDMQPYRTATFSAPDKECSVDHSGFVLDKIRDGETFSFRVIPNLGYVIESVTVFKGGSSNGTVMNAAAGVYSLVMTEDVHIEIITQEKTCDITISEPGNNEYQILNLGWEENFQVWTKINIGIIVADGYQIGSVTIHFGTDQKILTLHEEKDGCLWYEEFTLSDDTYVEIIVYPY
jgi:hypothetical protein